MVYLVFFIYLETVRQIFGLLCLVNNLKGMPVAQLRFKASTFVWLDFMKISYF